MEDLPDYDYDEGCDIFGNFWPPNVSEDFEEQTNTNPSILEDFEEQNFVKSLEGLFSKRNILSGLIVVTTFLLFVVQIFFW
jgi:hypothetical protein